MTMSKQLNNTKSCCFVNKPPPMLRPMSYIINMPRSYPVINDDENNTIIIIITTRRSNAVSIELSNHSTTL